TVIDADTLQFDFESDPVSVQGLQAFTIGAGAVKRLSDGKPSEDYGGNFWYDILPLAVTNTSPPVGSVTSLPLDLNFNEPILASSVQASDFTVNLGSVVSATLLDADTVRLTLGGLTNEGNLTVSLAAGALTDDFGNGNVEFSGSYVLEIETVPYPVPLTAKAPLGSLVYDRSISASIGVVGDTDTFTISLDPGQTISVLVTPSGPSLQPSVELRGPDNAPVGSVTAAGAGQRALLNTQSVATAGTYTISVSGASGTTGGYGVQLSLNAALEREGQLGGVANSTLATAQDLTESFISLGGTASRAAVLGASPEAASDGFETGNFSRLAWVTSGSANWYVTTEAAASGTYSARAGDINDNQSSTLSVTLTTGAGNVSFARRVS
ncbi:MAG TPA: hypothetical protein DCF63_12050, partial [Planctomycetaceae bacterium]|nr:hypothetical protein [Planctomycetaceae bacterium]